MTFGPAPRSPRCLVFAAAFALLATTACDETTTSGSDAGTDASSDVAPDLATSSDVAPDVATSSDAIDVAPGPDGPPGPDLQPDAPPVSLPPGCPAVVPAIGQACSMPAEGVECTYRTPCLNGRSLATICSCAGGQWSCLSDRGCAPEEPIRASPPPECQGSCTGTATCDYPIERCVGTDNLKGHCYCSNGTWACSREYDCLPPSTCRGADGCNCVTNGLVNTGNACPTGTTPGLCTSTACRPGDPRPGCIREIPGVPRSAVCVYGAWACPFGYTLGQCRK